MADNLYDHIIGVEPDKAPIHQLMAAMAEVDRGIITAVQAGAMFPTFGVGAQNDVIALIAELAVPNITRERVHDVFFLSEVSLAPYDTKVFFDTQLGI